MYNVRSSCIYIYSFCMCISPASPVWKDPLPVTYRIYNGVGVYCSGRAGPESLGGRRPRGRARARSPETVARAPRTLVATTTTTTISNITIAANGTVYGIIINSIRCEINVSVEDRIRFWEMTVIGRNYIWLWFKTDFRFPPANDDNVNGQSGQRHITVLTTNTRIFLF